MKKYGLKDITIDDYRNIGMCDLLDDVIQDFEDHNALRGVSKQHIQALLDAVVTTRNTFAERAGIKQKIIKHFKRRSNAS